MFKKCVTLRVFFTRNGGFYPKGIKLYLLGEKVRLSHNLFEVRNRRYQWLEGDANNHQIKETTLFIQKLHSMWRTPWMTIAFRHIVTVGVSNYIYLSFLTLITDMMTSRFPKIAAIMINIWRRNKLHLMTKLSQIEACSSAHHYSCRKNCYQNSKPFLIRVLVSAGIANITDCCIGVWNDFQCHFPYCCVNLLIVEWRGRL